MRRALVAAVLVVGALVSACSSGADATGFVCNFSTAGSVSFSSEDCRQRVSDSKCKDGGTEIRQDGGVCCSWLSCDKVPFPELER